MEKKLKEGITFNRLKVLLFLSVLASSCQLPKADLEKETKEILALDEKAKEFHFTKNAKAMADGFSDSFISINKGVVSQPTHEESYQRFDSYFKRVEFVKWDNVTPPVVRFSNDASLAYVAVDKLVVLKLKNENTSVMDTTHFAWLSVFKKVGSKWILDCIASTNRESQ